MMDLFLAATTPEPPEGDWLSLWAGLAGGLVAGLAALAAGFVGASSRLTRRRRTQERTLSEKVDELGAMSRVLRRLADEVTAEANAQIQIAEDAASRATKNQQLASLSEEQAKAVSEVFAAQGKFSTKLTIWIAVGSLVVSNVVTVIVTLALAPK